MATLQDKFNKFYSTRSKLETELNKIYGEINNAVDRQDGKVRIELLVVKCKEAFNKVVHKNEKLFDLARKRSGTKETVTNKTDIAAARGYINSVQYKERAEQ